MDWITDDVAIGNYLEAQDADLLRRFAFRSVLSLDGTLTAVRAVEFGLAEVVSYRLIDGPGNDLRVVRFAIDDLHRLVGSNAPVLVHCHAGRSRSAIVVAGYLMVVLHLGPEEAMAAVATRRTISVAPALVALLDQLDE